MSTIARIVRKLEDWALPLRLLLGRKIMYDDNRKIVHIWPNTLVKGPCSEQELEAMEYASAYTSIDLPRIYRTYRRHDGLFIAMEFVEGERLDHFWLRLTNEEQRNIVTHILDAVAELHTCYPTNEAFAVAPMSGGSVRDGSLSRTSVGPFALFEEFEAFLRRKQVAVGLPRHPQKTAFVHGDLAARNIIRRADGRFFILD